MAPGDMPPIGGMIMEGDLGGVALAVRDAARSVDLQAIRFVTQRGMFTSRILQALQLDQLDRFVADLYREGSAGAEGTARQLEQGRDALVDMVRRFVEEQYDIFARESTERIIERYLWDVRLTELEERHYDRMHFLIRKLVKRMNERYSRRRRRAKRGALDFKQTLRANMHHGGLLFETRWKKKRMNRPDVVMLCDVSRSMYDGGPVLSVDALWSQRGDRPGPLLRFLLEPPRSQPHEPLGQQFVPSTPV